MRGDTSEAVGLMTFRVNYQHRFHRYFAKLHLCVSLVILMFVFVFKSHRVKKNSVVEMSSNLIKHTSVGNLPFKAT